MLSKQEKEIKPVIISHQEEKINSNQKTKIDAKRGRPRVRPVCEKMMKARRDAANARERKRMNQMTKAYLKLKEKLPNNDKIISKKQIVDQVSYR